MSIIHDALKKVQSKIQDAPQPAPIPSPVPRPQAPREKPAADRSLSGILIPISLLAFALVVALVIILYRSPLQIHLNASTDSSWHPFRHPMFSEWTKVSEEAQEAAAHTPVQFPGPIQQTEPAVQPELEIAAAPEPELPAEEVVPLPEEELVVNGIVAMGAEHAALINDEIYEVGDSINEMTILNITIDQIELQAPEGVRKLQVTRK